MQETEQEKPEAHAGQSAALLTGRTEEFNRQLREQPADTQLWIQFIKYQVGDSLPLSLSLSVEPGSELSQLVSLSVSY